MIRKHYHSGGSDETGAADKCLVGLDAGATLTKIAIRAPGREASFELVAAGDRDSVSRRLAQVRPARVGITGARAAHLAAGLPVACAPVNEFAAWGAGAATLLTASGAAPDGRYLVVSLGTGTSVLLVNAEEVSRVGGTALGGGTLMGLGSLLLGLPGFEALCELASRGDRRRVDLLVSDIYPPHASPLPGELNAASFGKLGSGAPPPAPEDLAHAVMGLVGENVGLICGWLAAASQASKVVFGGSTLRSNGALIGILEPVVRAMGREPVFLERGEFSGALGALKIATDGG